MALIDKLNNIGNAIRAKTGGTEQLTLDQMPTEIANISTGVDLPSLENEGTAVDLVQGKEMINSQGEKVVGTNPYEKIATDETVEDQAELIAEIKEMINILPTAEDKVNELLLRENTTYTNNLVTSVGYAALCYHQKLESVNLPKVTTIDGMAFAFCSKLAEINLPQLNTTNNYAFRTCTSLNSIYLPNATKLPYAFVECSALTEVNLPKLQQTRGTFQRCTALTSLTLPTTFTYIDTSSFYNCTNLTSLTLLSPTRVTLGKIDAFENTPVANGTGYVYVPDDLVATYKASTNWSTYANQIKGISEAG